MKLKNIVISFLLIGLVFSAISQPAILPASVDVTAIGAATYTIPIEVVPGTKGMQPSLAITYNSVSGLGVLGARWNLQGISSITRIGQDRHFDGIVKPVMFDTSDRFALDGKRMLPITGTDYHANNQTYCFEVEDFTRIERCYNHNHLYFRSISQDGTIVVYGRSANSRFAPSASGSLAWMIEKVEDADGNYMLYSYTQSECEILLNRIDYTFLADGTPAYASIEFQYGNMNNPNDKYVSGQKIRQSKRLSSIDIKCMGNMVRQYKFFYETGTHYECLSRVEMFGPDGQSLTSTQFKWGDLFSMSSENQQISILQGGYRAVAGNFDDDRIYDAIVVCGNCRKIFYLEGSPDGLPTNISYGDTLSHLLSQEQLGFLREWATAVDVDGDGMDELLYWNRYYAKWHVLKKQGGSLVEVSSVDAPKSETIWGDFDGDGNLEAVTINTINDNQPALFSVGLEGMTTHNYDLPPSKQQIAGDFDGDGKMDIMSVGTDSGFHYRISTYDTRLGQWKPMENGLFLGPSPFCSVGDFNGDGMSDILFLTANDATWRMAIRKGAGLWSFSEVPRLDTAMSNFNSQLPRFIPIVMDINGDGKSDIIQPTSGNSAIYLITNGVFDNRYQILESGAIPLPPGQVMISGQFSVGDFDGNGVPDFLFCNTQQGGTIGSVKYICRNSYPGYFVERVTDRIQKKTFFNYKSISLMPERVLGDGMNWVSYPLVSSVCVSDGIGGYDTTKYYYGNALREPSAGRFVGFGFMGVKNGDTFVRTYSSWVPRDGQSHFDLLTVDSVVTTVNCSTSVSLPSVYSPNPNSLALITANRITKTACTNKSLYRTNALGNFTFLPYTYVTVKDNYLDNTRMVTRTTMNESPTVWRPSKCENSHRYVSDHNNVVESSVTDLSYTTVTVPNGATVMMPSCKVTKHTNNAAGINPRQDTIQYTYDTRGRLSSVRHSDNCGINTTESYTYNMNGVPLTKSVVPFGETPRTDYYDYDNTSRFVTTATDHAGNTTLRSFDPSTGLCLSETDHNGLLTTYTHDALGRPTLTTYPDATTKAIAYTDYNSGNPTNALGYLTVTESGKPMTRTYYDCLGRIIHTYIAGQGYTHTVYDHRGRVARKASKPYYGPALDYPGKSWTLFWYDNYGRVVKDSSQYCVNRYSFGIESNGPRHYSARENSMGAATKTFFDAAGRIVEVRDDGGTITYTYDRYNDNGKRLDRTTISSGGNSTTVFVNSNGNRTKLVDPDAGTITAKYNSWGQLLSQTDGKGDVTSMTYDSQGRLATKSYTLGQTTETYSYTYGTASPTEGKLLSVSKDNATCLEYGYDTYGRIISVTRHIDGTAYTHLYSYNSDGLLRTVQFPDGFTLLREYDAYGRLRCLKNNATGSEIYTIEQRNTFSQPTTCWFGNNTGVRYIYDVSGLVTGIRYGYKMLEPLRDDPIYPPDPGVSYYVGSQYSNLTYTYDDNGYIVAKNDSHDGQGEDYQYDNLGRLVNIMVNGSVEYDFSYDNNGNMTGNSKLGSQSYSYASGKPHAVTGVVDENGLVSSARCDVTWGSRNRATSISEDGWTLELGYGIGLQREKSVLRNGNTVTRTTHYVSKDCEREISSTGSRYIDYIYADGRIVALYVYNTATESDSIYYVQTDLLGSWERIVDEGRNIVQSCHFDPWGNRMKPDDWTASLDGTAFPFHRGFTGHEHYDRFGIINMNARLYDPVIARFFSPDPQIQDPYSTQGFNRYSYCGNNPVMYIDEDGEFAWLIPAIIGAVVGAYSGGVIANHGELSPWKWNFSSGTTWGYMAGGAVVGFVSGYVGGAIAAAQIPMANTISVIASSFMNSLGTSMYTGGKTPVSINFGFGTFDISNKAFRTFNSNNSWYENLAYGIGSLAVVSDILMGLNPEDIDLVTQHGSPDEPKDKVGHSAIVKTGSSSGDDNMIEPNGIISVGPDRQANPFGNWHWMKGINHWDTHTNDGSFIWRQTINVNKGTITKYAKWLNGLESNGNLCYSVEISSCVTHTSTALNLSGVFNIGIHPYFLALQMSLWTNGVRPWFYSYLLTQ